VKNWKTKVNAKAREVYGGRFVVCNVGLRYKGEKFAATASTAEGYGDDHTWDIEKSEDIADNAFRLGTFKLDKGFTGTLDIWVYSYETIADLKEGYEELEFNLYAKFENGKFKEVSA